MKKAEQMKSTKKPPSHYEVLVGNIGTVYSGPLFKQALKDYGEYKRQSIDNYGRAAGEPVILLQDGEPIMEVTYLEKRVTKVHEHRLGAIPDNHICPECGEESLSPIVDGSMFIRHGDFQATGIFSEKGKAGKQPVRLFCAGCDCLVPITAELAATLVNKAEK